MELLQVTAPNQPDRDIDDNDQCEENAEKAFFHDDLSLSDG